MHSGFQTAYASIASQVISAVKDELSSSGYSTLTITGHSLGAGLSSIATSSFIGSGIKVANTYTYGEPRNGDSAWVSYLGSQIPDDNYFRVTHYNDGVPQIPPPVLGFEHHGPEYWQSKKSDNSASTTFNCGANSTVSGYLWLILYLVLLTQSVFTLELQRRTRLWSQPYQRRASHLLQHRDCVEPAEPFMRIFSSLNYSSVKVASFIVWKGVDLFLVELSQEVADPLHCVYESRKRCQILFYRVVQHNEKLITVLHLNLLAKNPY